MKFDSVVPVNRDRVEVFKKSYTPTFRFMVENRTGVACDWAWVRVAVPQTHELARLKQVLVSIPGDSRPPMLGFWEQNVGRESSIFAVPVRVSGAFRTEMMLYPVHDEDHNVIQYTDVRVTFHPSVYDRLQDVMIRPGIGGDETSDVQLARFGPWGHVYSHEVEGDNGVRWQAWYTLFAASPVVHVEWRRLWSQAEGRFDAMIPNTFQCGEEFRILNAPLNGMPLASFSADEQAWVAATDDIPVIDGGAIEGRAVILCRYGAPQPGTQEWEETADPLGEAQRNLYAAGELYASPMEWGETFLGGTVVPVSTEDAFDDEILEAFYRDLKMGVRKDYYARRPIGMNPMPGDAGDQEDFGLTYTRPLWHRPGMIDLMWYSHMDGARGVFHYRNGKPVDVTTHPDWLTWSSRTNLPAGGELLGKPSNPGWGEFRSNRPRDEAGNATGNPWWGYDDQHRSQHLACALLAVTGSDLVRTTLEAYARTDSAIHSRRESGAGWDRIGAPRAVGRLCETWACMSWVLHRSPSVDALRIAIKKKFQVWSETFGSRQDGLFHILSVPGLYGIRKTDGSLPDTISVWEHALAWGGLKKFSLTTPWEMYQESLLAGDWYQSLERMIKKVYQDFGDIPGAVYLDYPNSPSREPWMFLPARDGLQEWVRPTLQAVGAIGLPTYISNYRDAHWLALSI